MLAGTLARPREFMDHSLPKTIGGVLGMNAFGADKRAGSQMPEAQIQNNKTVSAKWWRATLNALVSCVLSPLVYLLVYILLVPIYAAVLFAGSLFELELPRRRQPIDRRTLNEHTAPRSS